MCKLSIVTVNYNNANGLLDTIMSVKEQVKKGGICEHIIVDGGSSDHFQAAIESIDYESCKVISEPDDGLFDAMNKGVDMASGDSVIFLNSGDWFHPFFNLCHLQKIFDLKSQAVCCYTLQLSKEEAYVRPSVKKKNIRFKDFGHQGIFCPRSLLVDEPFDLRYPVSADSVWKEKVMGENGWVLNQQVSTVFELGGVSNSYTFSNALKLFGQKRGSLFRFKVLFKFFAQSLVGRSNLNKLLFGFKYDVVDRGLLDVLYNRHVELCKVSKRSD